MGVISALTRKFFSEWKLNPVYVYIGNVSMGNVSMDIHEERKGPSSRDPL